jgi:3-oxoacyl-[acyl-carrier-protein] synthase-3
MTNCRIRGIATAVPGRIVANDELYDLVGGEVAGKRLFRSIGIEERRWAPDGVTALDLCVAAADRLLCELGLDRSTIGAVVMVTQSPDFLISPATACVAQWKLGLGGRTLCFDVNQGCTGYLYGLAIAKGLVCGGLAKKVLLLVGDTLSRLCDPLDAATRPLFGDAGTATLIEESDHAGLLEFHFETDGSGWNVLATPVGGSRYPTLEAYRQWAAPEIQACFRYPALVNMDGEKVFSFCMEKVPGLVGHTLEVNQTPLEQLDFSIFHQANLMMIEALRRKSKLPKDTFLTSIQRFGNTTVATIPVTMTAEAARLQGGGLCLLAGFGVGLSLAGTLVRLDPDVHYCPLVEI